MKTEKEAVIKLNELRIRLELAKKHKAMVAIEILTGKIETVLWILGEVNNI